MPTKQQLVEELEELRRMNYRVWEVAGFYRDHFQRKLQSRKNFEKSHYRRGHHPFIPISENQLAGVIRKTILHLRKRDQDLEHRSYNFLDCGCGIGNIVILASSFGLRATGIEFDPRTFTVGKNLLAGRGDIYRYIVKGNILTFRCYGDYDIIYYYQPMTNYELMDKFIQKLIKDTKVGAIIIAAGNRRLLRQSDKFVELFNGIGTVYEKVKE